jgi:hypothetical protein
MSATAVIVVNYNGGAFLPRCLAAVLGQEPRPAEVLVVDNASRDGSADALPAGVRLLRRGTNDGYGAAVNAGLAATRAPLILTLNPDTELLPGALAAAVAAIERDPQAGSVALRVLQGADPTRLDAVGVGLTSAFGQINCAHGRPDAGTEVEPRAVLGPLGGAALWRREALDRVGPWCERWLHVPHRARRARPARRERDGRTLVAAQRVLHGAQPRAVPVGLRAGSTVARPPARLPARPGARGDAVRSARPTLRRADRAALRRGAAARRLRAPETVAARRIGPRGGRSDRGA